MFRPSHLISLMPSFMTSDAGCQHSTRLKLMAPVRWADNPISHVLSCGQATQSLTFSRSTSQYRDRTSEQGRNPKQMLVALTR
ncbi:hypothetical protein ElyMa_001390900 [Elysia marginata]|uniref:Secreted protein n=1 Tax=Elysia marginata TaxID=1093978 RepID=A0AAV4ITC2_9GAST|nr:hypothetical protein ElyMa_001390900 [Elysia marginata]